MNRILLLILICIISTVNFGAEINFRHGGMREAHLLDGGRVRISETFELNRPSKEITLNDFSTDIKRDSLVIENEEIEDIIFSINNSSSDSKDYYKGREVHYKDQKYTLLSLTPLIIERKSDGKVVINPTGEVVILPAEEEAHKNRVRVVGKNPMEKLNLSYEYEGMEWQKVYNINLDTHSLENIVILKNTTSKKFENLNLSYGTKKSVHLNLDPNVEKKIDLWKKNIKVEKKYLYRVSEGNTHPNVRLNIEGERVHSGTNVRIIEGRRYIGNMTSKEHNGVLSLDGITDNKIDIVKKDEELKFGEKFSRNSVDVSIKNYKNETVILEFIYDELPEKWYEMKSELPYEVRKGEIVFQVIIPANSRSRVNFSYIMEKI